MSRGSGDTLAFAERVLQVLDQGAFTATYKYAVLLGLLDLVLETANRDGEPATVVSTRQLAEKVVELYWPHTRDYAELPDGPAVLRQNRGQPGSQAEIVRAIQRFRARHAVDETAPLFRTRLTLGARFERLIDTIEWKLIQMPLPRLQRTEGRTGAFVYGIAWDETIGRAAVAAYQRGEPAAFDNRIRLLPGVPGYLLRLNSLLRPLIYRQWTAEVASINGLPEARLGEFLFGTDRIVPPRRLREGLAELQQGSCFYCCERLSGHAIEVDHFIPWARYPDNGVENLVLAHQRCNNAKRDFLAATPHVTNWLARFQSPDADALTRLSREAGWESRPAQTLGVASAIYLRLPAEVELWLAPGRFKAADRTVLARAFAGAR